MYLPFKKIRHRTFAVVLASSLLPFVLLTIFVITRVKTELTKKAVEMQKSLAKTIHQGLVSQILAYQKQLEEFARNITIQTMKPELMQTSIYKFLDLNPLFFSCYIYSPDGTVVCIGYRNRYQGHNSYLGKNIFKATHQVHRATAKALSEVLKTGKIVVSSEILKTHQSPQILVMVPIHAFEEPKKIIGVISCGIHIDGPSLQETIENYFLGENSFVLLTTHNGQVLAKKGKLLPEGLEKMNLSKEVSEKELESAWTTLNGVEYICTVGKIPVLNSIVAIGTPANEVLGFVWKILEGMFILTNICLVIAVFFSVLLSDTFVTPVLELIEGIRKVSDGVISHRIEVNGEDELSETCRAFNEMAEKLEKNRLLEELWSHKWKPPTQ